MKAFIILCVVTMAACAVDAPSEATDEQDLICGDNCDPGHAQTVIEAYFDAGQNLGASLGPPYCQVSSGWTECTGYYRDPWSQLYMLDCANRTGDNFCAVVPVGG